MCAIRICVMKNRGENGSEGERVVNRPRDINLVKLEIDRRDDATY